MKTRYCINCQKPIPFSKRKGIKAYLKRKYCSRQCANISIERMKPVEHPDRLKSCEICGKGITKEKNRNWNEYAKKRFCSRKCSAISQSQKIAVKCSSCEKKLERSPSHIRGEVFCSSKCRQNRKEFTCKHCNKKFTACLSNRTRENTFCSQECSRKEFRVKFVTIKCAFCEREIKRRLARVKYSKKRGTTFSFCSHKCKAAMMAAQYNPPKPYTGEHTTKPRNGHKTGKWRKAVKSRDNNTCQDCGAKPPQKMLAVHHIKPFALYPDLAYEVSNGVTLCYECHTKRHSPQITDE